MELVASPRHRVCDAWFCRCPKWSGWIRWERLVGLFPWFGETILGETVGVCPVCPVPKVGASSYFPVPLERTVYPQVGPLDPVDGSSQHFCHCALFRGHLFQRLPWFWIASSSCYRLRFLFTDTSCGPDDWAPLSSYLSFWFRLFFPNFPPLAVSLTNSELAVA